MNTIDVRRSEVILVLAVHPPSVAFWFRVCRRLAVRDIARPVLKRTAYLA